MTTATVTIGKRPKLEWLPVDSLAVDHRYQRTLESTRSQKLVAAIAERFHWSAFQAILATKKTGGGKPGWLVIDGQHRVEAARRRGIKEVPAVVVDAASLSDQAAAFVRANTDRVAVNPFALHRARVAGGEPDALAIDRICKRAGIEIPAYQIPSDNLKPGQTIALGTIARMPARFGEDVADLALRTVAKAYADRSGALRAPVFQAVAILLKAEIPAKRDALAAKIGQHLERTDSKKLELSALSIRGRSGGTEFAALVQILRKAIEADRSLPAKGTDDGFIKAPTREQLMRGR